MSDYAWFQPLPFHSDHLPNAHEPTHVQSLGDASNAPLGIYLSQEAAHFVNSFIQMDDQRPLTGILVGYAAQSEQRPFIVITGAIEAKGATTEKGIVHFPDATWQYMEKIWHREYPDTVIVGWFRSHPQRGTQLTTYDQFTQHRLFTCTWQVAFMIDPLNEASRFYCWSKQHLVLCESFYIFNEKQNTSYLTALTTTMHATSAAALASSATADSPHPHPKKRTISWLSFLFIIVLLFGACSALPWLTNNLPGTNEPLRIAEKQLQTITYELQQAKLDQERLRANAMQRAAPPAVPLVHFEHNENNAPNTVTLQPPSFVNSSSQPDNALSGTVNDYAYIVEQGDTLWEISHKILGNPYAYRWIAELNDIGNPDIIYPGMSLKVERNSEAVPAQNNSSAVFSE